MIDVAGGLLFQGAYVYPAREGATTGAGPAFAYLPSEPEPETDPQGRATVSFIATGAGGFLQLGARLTVSEQTVDTVRQELATRLKLDAPELVALTPAPLQVKGASLELGDGAGEYRTISTSDTSGFPPYTALFNAQLDAGGGAAVSAALNGREQFLRVRYHAVVSLPVQASARLWGDARSLLAELRSIPLDTAHQFARGLIEQALTAGTLVLDQETAASTPEELSRRAVEEAKERLVEMLLQARRGNAVLPGQVSIEGSAALEEWVERPLDLVGDVAKWLGGRGQEHLMVSP